MLLLLLGGCTAAIAELGYTSMPDAGLQGGTFATHATLEMLPDEGYTRVGGGIGAGGRIRTYGPYTTVEQAPEATFLIVSRVRKGPRDAWDRWLVTSLRASPWMGGAFGPDARGFVFAPEVQLGAALCMMDLKKGCITASIPVGHDGGDPTHPAGWTVGFQVGFGWAGEYAAD